MFGNNRSELIGRPVPTPNFNITENLSGNAPRPGDLLITIQSDKLENAHLKIEPVTIQNDSSINTSTLRTTGVVEPNAYKVVPVIPVAGGIVKQVNVQLGDRVIKGQKLAVVFSTDLADAQSSYLNMQAEIERHHNRYKRAKQLLDIGATSHEEFELVATEYKVEQVKLSAARQKLILLGMNSNQLKNLQSILTSQVNSLISLDAPVSGIILNRYVNTGEVVSMGKELFSIADLSTVWIVG